MEFTQLKQIIFSALLKTNYRYPNTRIKIYTAAFKAFKGLDLSDETSQLTNKFLKVIDELEDMITENDTLKVSVIFIDNDTIQFDTVEPTRLPSNPVIEEINVPEVTPDYPLEGKKSKPALTKLQVSNKFVKLGLVVAVLSSLIIFISYLNTNENTADDGKTDQNIANRNLPGDVLFQANFFGDLSQFDEETQSLKQRITLTEDKQAAIIKGKAVFTGKDFIPVDVKDSYIMKIAVKYLEPINQGDTGLFVGFMTFDGEKNLETLAPGTHRYFVTANKIQPSGAALTQDWVELFGVISGTQNNHQSFRPTTKYVKPFILVNNKQPEQVIFLRNIELSKF